MDMSSIAAHKQQIIKSFGTPVSITRPDNTTIAAHMVIGKLSTGSSSNFSMFEGYRKGQSVPLDRVDIGSLITDATAGTQYLAVSGYLEEAGAVVTSRATHLLKINSQLSVTRETKTYGSDLTASKAVTPILTNHPIFFAENSQELKDTGIGIIKDSKFIVYMKHYDIAERDSWVITNGGVSYEVEVTWWDEITYDGVLLVGLSTDVRKVVLP